MRSHHPFLFLALLLLVAWVVLKIVLGMAGAIFHLLWIAAIVFAIIWLIRQVSGGPRPPV